jgi:hypothetical protein
MSAIYSWCVELDLRASSSAGLVKGFRSCPVRGVLTVPENALPVLTCRVLILSSPIFRKRRFLAVWTRLLLTGIVSL